MTESQRRVFDFVAQYLVDNGYAPTIREISAGVGFSSPSSAFHQLEHLRQEGLLVGSGRRLRLGFRASGLGAGAVAGDQRRSA